MSNRYCCLLDSGNEMELSSRLYIQQQVYVKQQYLFTYTCCCMYSLELLMMDGKTVRNTYTVIPKIK
jgi:hypothetical protein